MPATGRNLFYPTLAAIALAVYAGIYTLLLVIFLGDLDVSPIWVAFFLGLAATPFMALVHLARAKTPDVTPRARPLLMTFVMAAPLLFWGYFTLMLLIDTRRFGWEDFHLFFAIGGVPALLSLVLTVTFARLALQSRKGGSDG